MAVKYPKEIFTFGSELELVDTDQRIELGHLGQWNREENTLVNSSGLGVDNTKKMVSLGGEVNVTPTDTIEEQVKNIKEILELLPRKNINHTCDFHVHVGVPGLSEDLETVKDITKYFFEHQERILEITREFVEPSRKKYSRAAYEAAKKYDKFRKKQNGHPISEAIFDKMMKARTMEEYFQSYVSKNKDGGYNWHFVNRTGINLFQLKYVGTVEFRHFFSTLEINEMESALRWSEAIMDAALNSKKTPDEVLEELGEVTFPKHEYTLYDHKLGTIHKKTHFGKLKKSEIRSNIDKMLKECVIIEEDLGENF